MVVLPLYGGHGSGRRYGDALDWTVLKSIQEANAASMRAMEEYLLLAVDPDAVGDIDQTREFIQRSIDQHERIIDQLELAAGELESNKALTAD